MKLPKEKVQKAIFIGLLLVVSFCWAKEDLIIARPVKNSLGIDQSSKTLDYFLVITGSEVLRGIYADGHTKFLTQSLSPLGYRCVGSLSVGDIEEDLLKALNFGRKQVPLVITTGGLGPTMQDITGKVIAKYTGIALKEHPKVLLDLKKRFGGLSGILRPVLRGQALTPVRGTYMPNPNGTAVGLVFESDQYSIVALPGPPRELQPMVKNELIPLLSKKYGLRMVGHSITMRFAGIGQSSIDRIIREKLIPPGDLMIWSSFNANRVDITLSLPGNTNQDMQRLKKLEDNLLKYTSSYMYSDKGLSLEQNIFQLLKEQKSSLIISEIASGGELSSSLLQVDPTSRYLKGSYVAGNSQMMNQLLNGKPDFKGDDSSENVVYQIAELVAKKKANWVLVIGPVSKDKDESQSVWIATGSMRKGFVSRKIGVRKGRRLRQDRLVTHALNLLRKELSEHSPRR